MLCLADHSCFTDVISKQKVEKALSAMVGILAGNYNMKINNNKTKVLVCGRNERKNRLVEEVPLSFSPNRSYATNPLFIYIMQMFASYRS